MKKKYLIIILSWMIITPLSFYGCYKWQQYDNYKSIWDNGIIQPQGNNYE